MQVTVIFMADLAECVPDKAAWADMWHSNEAFLKAKDALEKAAEAEVRQPYWRRCVRWAVTELLWHTHHLIHVIVAYQQPGCKRSGVSGWLPPCLCQPTLSMAQQVPMSQSS